MSEMNTADEAVKNWRELSDNFYRLSRRILRYASMGSSRVEFWRAISLLLLRFSRCDVVEFRVQDGTFNYIWEAVNGKGIGYSFEIIPGLIEGDALLPVKDDGSSAERIYKYTLTGRFKGTTRNFTKNASFWYAAPGVIGIPDGPEDALTPYNTGDISGEYISLLAIRYVIDEYNTGLLVLKSTQQNCFSETEIDLYEDIAETLGIAISDRRAQYKLRERVREIRCLFEISRLASIPNASLEDTIIGIVNLLPSSVRSPDIAMGRIILDGIIYETDGFLETPHRISSDIVINGEKRGVIEICYEEVKIDLQPGVFVHDEHKLIDAVAGQIGVIIESRSAEEERALLQTQLQHADRLATIGQLAAGVAHEINEPLGGILGFAQLIQKDEELSEQSSKDIEKIISAALHSREIVRKLLLFARQLPTKKSVIDLNELIEDSLFIVESRSAKENVSIERILEPGLPRIEADPSQMQQILVNLVVNAVHAMPGGGEVVLRTESDNGSVKFSVEDDGTGMKQEVVDQIFLPFFTTKGIGQGTGLGLAVVHGIVKSHGGSIEVHSVEGQGSRFDIKIPIYEGNTDRNMQD